MKNRLQAIWRLIVANEFFVITPLGINGMCIKNSGSKIESIVNQYEEKIGGASDGR